MTHKKFCFKKYNQTKNTAFSTSTSVILFCTFTVKERIKNIQEEFPLVKETNKETIVKIIVPLTE